MKGGVVNKRYEGREDIGSYPTRRTTEHVEDVDA